MKETFSKLAIDWNFLCQIVATTKMLLANTVLNGEEEKKKGCMQLYFFPLLC